MKKSEIKMILIKNHLNSPEELIQHIITSSSSEINLNECKINFIFDFRSILIKLKEENQLFEKITIQEDINEFNYRVVYCILEIPFRCEGTIFSQGAYFELIHFKSYVQFTGATFRDEYSFKKSTFHEFANFGLVDFEMKKFTDLDKSFYKSCFVKPANFISSKFFGLANFSFAKFHDVVNIRDTEFNNLDLAHIETKVNFELEDFHSAKIHQVNNRLTGLFLKKTALLKNDSILSIHFQKLEMDAYRKSLRITNNVINPPTIKKITTLIKICCDRFLLLMNKLSNDYGTSWFRGVVFTIMVWFIFFSWFAMAKYGIGSTFIWTDDYFLKKAVDYFWLFNGINGLSEERTSWSEIFPFILGKILIGYGIYQTISAFRKFGKTE